MRFPYRGLYAIIVNVLSNMYDFNDTEYLLTMNLNNSTKAESCYTINFRNSTY